MANLIVWSVGNNGVVVWLKLVGSHMERGDEMVRETDSYERLRNLSLNPSTIPDLVVELWISCFVFLNLTFLIYKMGMII